MDFTTEYGKQNKRNKGETRAYSLVDLFRGLSILKQQQQQQQQQQRVRVKLREDIRACIFYYSPSCMARVVGTTPILMYTHTHTHTHNLKLVGTFSLKPENT